jgi:uncharacterized protein (TIGR02246 family)
MIVSKISFALLLSLSAISTAFCGMQVDAKTPKTSSHHKELTSTASDEAAIRAQISALAKNLADGDAVGLGFLWTIDGTYIDDDGNETKGRADLVKRFFALFKENGKRTFDLVPEEVRILANSVGYSEGTVRRKQSDKAIPETRFSMVFVKQNGTWLISAAAETPIASTEHEHASLADLAWMVGNWKAERAGGSVRMSADWTANKNFIHCKYEINKPNQPQSLDMQVIGWDPRNNQIVSWSFDSTGGHGFGTWYRQDRKWVVESTAIEHDGSMSRSINVLEPIDANAFTWQCVNRSIDGVALGDTAPLKVERVNQ